MEASTTHPQVHVVSSATSTATTAISATNTIIIVAAALGSLGTAITVVVILIMMAIVFYLKKKKYDTEIGELHVHYIKLMYVVVTDHNPSYHLHSHRNPAYGINESIKCTVHDDSIIYATAVEPQCYLEPQSIRICDNEHEYQYIEQ